MLMVRGADPVYGVPGAAGLRDALSNVPFIFSFSGLMDDTTAMSDLILPEHVYLEDWGSDVPEAGPGYEMVGFQQPVVRPFFEAARRTSAPAGSPTCCSPSPRRWSSIST